MATNPLLERLKKSIQKKQGIKTSDAFALAESILIKNKYMKKWTMELTARGKIKARLPEWTKWIPKKVKASKSLKDKIKNRYVNK